MYTLAFFILIGRFLLLSLFCQTNLFNKVEVSALIEQWFDVVWELDFAWYNYEGVYVQTWCTCLWVEFYWVVILIEFPFLSFRSVSVLLVLTKDEEILEHKNCALLHGESVWALWMIMCPAHFWLWSILMYVWCLYIDLRCFVSILYSGWTDFWDGCLNLMVSWLKWRFKCAFE